MAACYFDYLKSKLTAGGNGQQLLQCEQLGEAVQQQLIAAGSSSGSSNGFANMSVDAAGVDGRLKVALNVLHDAAASAAAGMLQRQANNNSSSSSTQSRKQMQ